MRYIVSLSRDDGFFFLIRKTPEESEREKKGERKEIQLAYFETLLLLPLESLVMGVRESDRVLEIES